MSKTWNEFLRNLPFGKYESNIPNELSEQMFNDLRKTSLFRQYALTLRTNKQEVLLPCDKKCSYGVCWSDSINSDTKGEWETVRINTHILQSNIIITNDLMDNDTMNVQDIIYSRVINAMNIAENEVFLYGDGNNKPTGLLSETIIKEIETITINEEITTDEFINSYMQFNPIFKSNAIWIVNKKFMNFLFKFNKTNLLINPSNYINSPMNFINTPIFVMDTMKDEHLALLVDLSHAYCIVDRSETINILKDPYSKKPNTEFLFYRNMGGYPSNPKACILFRSNN